MLDSIPQQQRQDSIALASAVLGLDVKELVTTDHHKALNQTEITQPLLLLSHYLHFRKDYHHKTLNQQDWMIGHSLG